MTPRRIRRRGCPTCRRPFRAATRPLDAATPGTLCEPEIRASRMVHAGRDVHRRLTGETA